LQKGKGTTPMKVNLLMLALVLCASTLQAGSLMVVGSPAYDAATATGWQGGGVSSAGAVNNSGAAVGSSEKIVSGSDKGSSAVRWDASGTAATELDSLGTDSGGWTSAGAYAVNAAGTAVGYARKYVNGTDMGYSAAIWLPDATVIDLNDLGVAPAAGGGTWSLTSASAISNDGWVAGGGSFDPDGAGPLAAYDRLWVGRVGLGGNWLNTSGTNNAWGRGANWSTGTPAIQLDAVFNQPAAYTVLLAQNETARNVTVTGGTVTLDLAGHSLAVDSTLSIAGPAQPHRRFDQHRPACLPACQPGELRPDPRKRPVRGRRRVGSGPCRRLPSGPRQ
jgi:hypothetical protein